MNTGLLVANFKTIWICNIIFHIMSFHTSSIRHSFAVKKLLQGYAEIIFKKTQSI